MTDHGTWQDGESSAAPVPLLAANTPRAPIRVLVVEDDLQVGAVVVRMLRGMDATLASSGGEAIPRLSEGMPFDVVLCDMRLGDMDGLELYKTVRAQMPEREIPFVFMSGDPSISRAVSAVGATVVIKPFTMEEIVAVVLSAVRSRADSEGRAGAR